MRTRPGAVPWGWAALVLMALLLAGCGSSASHPNVTTTKHTVLSADDSSANLILWVSNQSFVDEKTRIDITLDGGQAVDQKFKVEQQHNWKEFRLRTSPGKHQIEVRGGKSAHLTQQLTVLEKGPRYVVIAYWHEPEASSGLFTLESLDQAPGFA
jgi:hypothetical protein